MKILLSKIQLVTFFTLFSIVFSIPSTAEEKIYSNPFPLNVLFNSIASEWNDVELFPLDQNDTTNDINNPINWVSAGMAHDAQRFFIIVNNQNTISSDNPSQSSTNTLPWGWQIFIDTDNNPLTGFNYSNVIGADYLLEGHVLHEYNGSGNSWDWNVIPNQNQINRNLSYRNSRVLYFIPREQIDYPETIRVVFNGENEAYGGNITDLYPDDAHTEQSNERFFTYSFGDNAGQTNHAPVAINQELTVMINEPVEFKLNVTDRDNDALSIVRLFTSNFRGTLDLISEEELIYRYTPPLNFIGETGFIYEVTDGELASRASIKLNTIDNNPGVISNTISTNEISIDGSNSDWSGLQLFRDSSDIESPLSSINWVRAGVAHDTTNIYLLYENKNPIEPNETSGSELSWGWQVFLDSDKNTTTGYVHKSRPESNNIGADYLIEGNFVYKYVGDGRSWDWIELGKAEAQYAGSIAELVFPRSWLNLENPNVKIAFFGDSRSHPGFGNGQDRYPDSGSFEYNFGAGIVGRTPAVSINQPGLHVSPADHNPDFTRVVSVDDLSGSGGGTISWLLLMLFSLFFTNRYVNSRKL